MVGLGVKPEVWAMSDLVGKVHANSVEIFRGAPHLRFPHQTQSSVSHVIGQSVKCH
jgi:hypothetical protein